MYELYYDNKLLIKNNEIINSNIFQNINIKMELFMKYLNSVIKYNKTDNHYYLKKYFLNINLSKFKLFINHKYVMFNNVQLLLNYYYESKYKYKLGKI